MNDSSAALPATPAAVERVRVPKTAEVVAQSLRNQIVRGMIPEDGALPSEAELMRQFGISRPSLREAFRILESEQLIVVRRGAHGGARATRPSVTVAARYLTVLMQYDDVELRDVFEARALFEPLALQLLARQDDRERIVELLTEQLDHALEVDSVSNEDRATRWVELILAMFEYGGNRTMFLLYSALTEVAQHEVIESLGSTQGPDSELNTRKAVRKAFKLVAAGKGEEAAKFWRQQISLVGESVQQRHESRTLVDIANTVM